MVFPEIRLHQLYSLNLCEDLDIIFEDLSMIDIKHIEDVIKSLTYDKLSIVPGILTINTTNNTISLTGNKINSTTYMINKQGRGDILFITYNIPTQNIITCLEHLYHIYKSLYNKSLKE